MKIRPIVILRKIIANLNTSSVKISNVFLKIYTFAAENSQYGTFFRELKLSILKILNASPNKFSRQK